MQPGRLQGIASARPANGSTTAEPKQPVRFPARWIVGRSTAIQAAGLGRGIRWSDTAWRLASELPRHWGPQHGGPRSGPARWPLRLVDRRQPVPRQPGWRDAGRAVNHVRPPPPRRKVGPRGRDCLVATNLELERQPKRDRLKRHRLPIPNGPAKLPRRGGATGTRLFAFYQRSKRISARLTGLPAVKIPRASLRP